MNCWQIETSIQLKWFAILHQFVLVKVFHAVTQFHLISNKIPKEWVNRSEREKERHREREKTLYSRFSIYQVQFHYRTWRWLHKNHKNILRFHRISKKTHELLYIQSIYSTYWGWYTWTVHLIALFGLKFFFYVSTETHEYYFFFGLSTSY